MSPTYGLLVSFPFPSHGAPHQWGLTATPSGVGWSRLGCEGSASESSTSWHVAAASESLTYALFFKVRNPSPETRGPAAMKPGLGWLPQGGLASGGELSGRRPGLDQALTAFFTMSSEVAPSISRSV